MPELQRSWLNSAMLLVSMAWPGELTPQNLVQDGSFEYPDAPDGGLTTHFGSLGYWTIEQGSIDVVDDGYWSAWHGQRSIDLNGISPGTIFQDLATIPGAEYDLFFALAGNPNLTSIKTVRVWWGPVSGALSEVGTYSFDQTGTTRTSMGWITIFARDLVATSASTRLRFESLNTEPDYGPALDDIVVAETTSTVPEPLGVLLVGTGLLGVGAARRRRRLARP